MSRRNAPNNNGGGLWGGVLNTLAGTSEAESKDKSGGHATPGGRTGTETPKDKGKGQTAGAGRASTETPKDKANGHGAAASRIEASGVKGLAELIEVLRAMAAAPLGARPKLDTDLIDKIGDSPLQPVLSELQPIYKKLGPLEGSPEHLQAQAQAQASQQTATNPPASQPGSAPGPGPSSGHSQPSQSASGPASGSPPTQQPPATPAALDLAELKNMEAALGSLSAKVDFVAHAVAGVHTRGEMGENFQLLETSLRKSDSATRDEVKTAATGTKTQIEAVENKVSQMTGQLNPVLAELRQGVNRLQVGLLEDVKAERARLETKVKELENENKVLQRVIHDTNVELLPVEVVSKIALQGTFTDGPETDKPGAGKPGAGKPGANKPDAGKSGSRGVADSATPNLLQTAQKVRHNTLGLVAKCRALFTFIAHDPERESDNSDLVEEGEWGRCAEHVRASHSKLHNAVKEKEEYHQKLEFVGFVIEQIREGHYTVQEWESDANWKSFGALAEMPPDGFASIQHLAQDLSRLTAQATTPPVSNGPTSSTAFEGSQTPTAKPANATSQDPAEHTSTPAFTAPSSPDVQTVPAPEKTGQDASTSPTKKRSSSIRIKMVFNPNPGPLYGWGPIVTSR